MSKLKLFLLALGFYTRLPCPKNQDFSLLPQASICLPLVGWLIGGFAGLSYYLADLVWPQTAAVIVSISCGILLTGAFHEDGFADVCDGFGGGYGKQQILVIMKDSRIGAYGTLGLLLLIALKISLLSALPTNSIPLALFAGHSISRLSPLLLMRKYVYARNDSSKGSSAVYKPSAQELLFAGAIAVLPLLLLPLLCSLAILFIGAVNWCLGKYFNHHIGGYTGDCLGASQQVAETVFYLSASALWTST
jgi:adenosylcobinamide-GDP ribazoletransferase